jgi:uncharacterized protein YkuJ
MSIPNNTLYSNPFHQYLLDIHQINVFELVEFSKIDNLYYVLLYRQNEHLIDDPVDLISLNVFDQLLEEEINDVNKKFELPTIFFGVKSL